MGRPRGGTLGSFDTAIVGQLLKWRDEHPKWGARTLRTELGLCGRFARLALPGVSTVARLLREHGLTAPVVRGRPKGDDVDRLPVSERPHQRWQVDAKGNERAGGVGVVGMIDVKDTFSHCYTCAFPVAMASLQGHPTGDHYRLALRLAFCEHGLCEELQCDHDSVFYDNQHASPFPTRLHLWLVALGVRPVFSRVRTPTDQGQVERSHRTVWAQVHQKSDFANWSALYEACRQRRHVLNFHLPCSSLDGQPPLKRFPEAAHSGRHYRPEREWDMLDLLKVDTFLASRTWQRQVNDKGCVKIAKQVYHVGDAVAGEQLDIGFDVFTRTFSFQNKDGLLLGHRPAKGLDKKDLIGDYPINLPKGFQLQIPFGLQTECLTRLYETPLTRDNET